MAVIEEPIDSLSEDKKKDPNWLKANIDYSIYACRNPWREEQILAYQLISGIRDVKQFEYLTKTYGIEFPAKMSHIPLIKTLLDALIGEESDKPISHKVGIKDAKSLEQVKRNKVKAIMEAIRIKTMNVIKNNMGFVNGETDKKDAFLENHFREIQEYHDTYWRDLKVIGAERAKDYIVNKSDMKRKKNTMFRDLCITGTEYYKLILEERGKDPNFIPCNPLNIYYFGSEDVQYLKDCDRVVYKEYLTRSECISRWGHLMKDEDVKALNEKKDRYTFSGVSIYDDYFRMGITNYPEFVGYYNTNDIIEVCHVEWKSNTRIALVDDEEISDHTEKQMIEMGNSAKIKYRYRIDRYEGIRIGSDIYLKMGKSKHIVRPIDDPWYCSLTFNGVMYNKRNSIPYSLVISTKDLQDKYDILNYFLENHFALSGTKGTRVVLENIPHQFGSSITERIKKYLYYKKSGLEIVSLSQDGAQDFNNYGTYDDTISQSVEVIISMMQYLESLASRIIGVPPQRIGAIQKNELVGNTEMAINNSIITTKPLFALHDSLLKELLNDLVNACAFSWRDSKKKNIILGDGIADIFTLDVESFCTSDYNIFWEDSGIQLKQIEELKALAGTMIQSQLLDAEQVIDIITLDSVTQIRNKIKKAIQSNKENNMAQAQEQLKQAQEEIKKLQQQVEKNAQQDIELKKRELDIDEQKVLKDQEYKEKEIANKADVERQKLELERKRVELEQMQITFSNNSFEVRNK